VPRAAGEQQGRLGAGDAHGAIVARRSGVGRRPGCPGGRSRPWAAGTGPGRLTSVRCQWTGTPAGTWAATPRPSSRTTR
jgi:hypothetical protein